MLQQEKIAGIIFNSQDSNTGIVLHQALIWGFLFALIA
jgi:hypothetical protein